MSGEHPGHPGGHPSGFFDAAYEGSPPWDIGRPQPAIVDLEAEGLVRGAVLDVGCGTGENILFVASGGHPVTGIDSAAQAIGAALRKAAERGIAARFEVADVLGEMPADVGVFDTVIDVGFFHMLSDPQRHAFADVLQTLLRPGGLYLMECFSDRVPGTFGPRRVSEAEVRETFDEGWAVRDVREAALVTAQTKMPEIPALLAVIERL